jgi:hypothetical protein
MICLASSRNIRIPRRLSFTVKAPMGVDPVLLDGKHASLAGLSGLIEFCTGIKTIWILSRLRAILPRPMFSRAVSRDGRPSILEKMIWSTTIEAGW